MKRSRFRLADMVRAAVSTRSAATATLGMVGKKYGRLLVLGLTRRRYSPGLRKDGQRNSRWLIAVRCDCGNEYETEAPHVRDGATRQCRACHATAIAQRQRRDVSFRLPTGKTIAEVAIEAGLPIGTVYRRFLRGWPVEKLGAPKLPPHEKRGYGRNVDLPERRRLVYPHHGRRHA